ncbi:hypothetical protein TSUD_220960 [Trifolium subterraneum]|uniref:Uncharacterized protein n=1 Tax=Trifolium subterraneum TaxID=3900 RepID=A0A2Z6NR19_TRISU|nr:hypothetical protein TSUD_220960 [Trifolium subterraneum]
MLKFESLLTESPSSSITYVVVVGVGEMVQRGAVLRQGDEVEKKGYVGVGPEEMAVLVVMRTKGDMELKCILLLVWMATTTKMT